MPLKSILELGQKVRSNPTPAGRCPEASHTEFFLAPVTMQVDPQLPSNVVFHARVFFIMQAIQCTAHDCIHLGTRSVGTRDKSDSDTGEKLSAVTVAELIPSQRQGSTPKSSRGITCPNTKH